MEVDLHGGLERDLARLNAQALQRRRLLMWLAGASTLALAGCGGSAEDSTSSATTSGTTTGTSTSTGTGSCTLIPIPDETAGPYPGDGSNIVAGSVVNALALTGIVRADIRSSIAGATGVAQGVPLVIRLKLVSTSASCASLAGYAIYLWHCDREGRYSMYSTGVAAENYLRGVQQSDANGELSFTTIFPGCYAGRMPHMHFEVYRSLAAATSYANRVKTSQIAFPVATCGEVYASTGYETSAANFRGVSFATDNVFSDGVDTQMAAISGDLSGYTATLTIGIAA